MSDSHDDRNPYFFIKVVVLSVLFLVLGVLGHTSIVDMHNDGPDNQEIAAKGTEVRNHFWQTVIDGTGYSDTASGHLARDLAPLLRDTERISAEFGTDSMIYPDRLEDVRVPSLSPYKQAETDLNTSVFEPADGGLRFSPDFLGKLRLSQTAQAESLMEPVDYPKPGEQWDYYSYYGLTLTYFIATLLAFFLAGICESRGYNSYRLYGWNVSNQSLLARLLSVVVVPWIFAVWCVVHFLAWPRRSYVRRKQEMLDWTAQEALLEGNPYRDQLRALYKSRKKLEQYAKAGSTVAEKNLLTLNEYISTVEQQMPLEVKSWIADDASRSEIPEIEEIQLQIATMHASTQEMFGAEK